MLQHLTELLVKFKFDLSEDVSETGGGVMITHLGISAIYDKIPGGLVMTAKSNCQWNKRIC